MIGLLLWFKQTTAFDKQEFKRGLVAAAVLGLIVYAVWLWLANPLPWFFAGILFDVSRHLWQQGEVLVALLWALNLCLAPGVGVVLSELSPFRGESTARSDAGQLKSVSQTDYERDERDEQVAISTALAQFEGMVATTPSAAAELPGRRTAAASAVSPLITPAPGTGYASLGTYRGGELDQWVYSGELCILPDFLELHGLLIGEPKQGKTWTLIRLAMIARSYGRKVVFLDMKGSRKTAALFLAAMSMMKVSSCKIYPLEAYDGWRGSSKHESSQILKG